MYTIAKEYMWHVCVCINVCVCVYKYVSVCINVCVCTYSEEYN